MGPRLHGGEFSAAALAPPGLPGRDTHVTSLWLDFLCAPSSQGGKRLPRVPRVWWAGTGVQVGMQCGRTAPNEPPRGMGASQTGRGRVRGLKQPPAGQQDTVREGKAAAGETRVGWRSGLGRQAGPGLRVGAPAGLSTHWASCGLCCLWRPCLEPSLHPACFLHFAWALPSCLLRSGGAIGGGHCGVGGPSPVSGFPMQPRNCFLHPLASGVCGVQAR